MEQTTPVSVKLVLELPSKNTTMKGRSKMKRTFTILVSLILALALLSGCSNSFHDLAAIMGGGDSAPPAPELERSYGGDTGGVAADPARPEAPAMPDEFATSAERPPMPSADTEAGAALSIMSDTIDNGYLESQRPDTIRPGLLTAGEWNDNKNHDFILNLMQTNADFRSFESMWSYNLQNQVVVNVTDNGKPVNNARVELLDDNQNSIYSALTNNKGVAYLFVDLRNTKQQTAAYVRASKETSETVEFDPAIRTYDFSLRDHYAQASLDLMFVIDTTGSMGDELEYLKAELEDIIGKVSRDNANIDIRLSINVYRDIGDEYVVRSTPFETNIRNQVAFLRDQEAQGGGDWEEAVEQALADALEAHNWNNNATAKLMFLVLDAPPHNTDKIRNEMHRLTELSADMGVRIIPIASTGIDKVTEFLLRALAMATGGTYVFLTDHSGIGDPHLEPTIGDYDVELLNELLVRLIDDYIS